MLTKLRKDYWQKYRSLTKELEAIKMSQSKPDNYIADLETDLESKNSRLSDKEEWINDLEAR